MQLDAEMIQLVQTVKETVFEQKAEGENEWRGSPFEWLRHQAPTTRGMAGRLLVSKWLKAHGFDAQEAGVRHADLRINGVLFEVRFSTRWDEELVYSFNQIKNEPYHALFCLGVSPHAVHLWLLPKSVLQEYVFGHLGQHTGSGARETSWLRFPPNFPPDWLQPYGPAPDPVFDTLAGLHVMPGRIPVARQTLEQKSLF